MKYSIYYFFIFILILIMYSSSLSAYSPNIRYNVNSFSDNGLKKHDPIIIESDEDFTRENGVVGGSGTPDDPYIIEGWFIDGAGENDGIVIGSVTKYFIIRNCKIVNTIFGILLDNIRYAKIYDNEFIDNYQTAIIVLGNGNTVVEINDNYIKNTHRVYNDPKRHYDGIIVSNCNRSLIYNNYIENVHYGIKLEYETSNTKVYRNTIVKSNVSIALRFSHNNEVYNNTLEAELTGISLPRSNNNDIHGNSIKSLNDGIYMESSNSNIIYNNRIESLLGIVLDGVNNDIFKNKLLYGGLFIPTSINIEIFKNNVHENTVNGKSVIYLDHAEGITINNSRIGQIILLNSRNIVIRNLKMINVSVAVQLINISSSIIHSCTFKYNIIGIHVIKSNNISIYSNMLEDIRESGIALIASRNNIVYNNTIKDCGWHSIWGSGIFIWGSIDNIFYENTIKSNKIGVFLWSSSNNTFHHNLFINNKYQVNITGYGNLRNTWDAGYPLGGNYWSDYNGTDKYKGVYQNETGSDGLGDIEYRIDENNIDHYPLMNPSIKLSLSRTSELLNKTSMMNNTLTYSKPIDFKYILILTIFSLIALIIFIIYLAVRKKSI